MTREEELELVESFIEKNGVTLLPPDERGPETMFSAWGKPRAKRGRKKAAAPKDEAKE